MSYLIKNPSSVDRVVPWGPIDRQLRRS